MKKSKYADQQIAFALRQAQTGTRVEEIFHKFGISQAIFTIGRRSMVGWAYPSCVG